VTITQDTRFRTYFKAFFSDILTGMSGPLSVPFVIAAFWSSGRVQKILYGVLAFVCATFASYRVWRKDRLAATAELDARKMSLNTIIAEQRHEIANRDEKIRLLTEKAKRTPAEQHDYDKLKKALEMFKQTGHVALRYIRSVGTVTFGQPYPPTLPSDLTPDKALWVYRHCATEGLLNSSPNTGRTQETFSVPPKLEKIYDEVLFPE
jgi:hypothetical protein